MLREVLQTSERLCPSVTAELRDAIQETVRSLQEQWESCEDDSAVGVREAAREQKQFNELQRRLADLSSWLHGFRQKLHQNDQMLPSSLADKKNAVRLHSVSC
jgi:chromosome segregation ATPase